jgi:hypothetical protein
MTDVQVIDPDTHQQWKQHLGGNYRFRSDSEAWLTPLNRRESFFEPRPPASAREEVQRKYDLTNGRVRIYPVFLAGWTAIPFDFSAVRLRDYEVMIKSISGE